jgi:hypothetical protein
LGENKGREIPTGLLKPVRRPVPDIHWSRSTCR